MYNISIPVYTSHPSHGLYVNEIKIKPFYETHCRAIIIIGIKLNTRNMSSVTMLTSKHPTVRESVKKIDFLAEMSSKKNSDKM